jgi:hypothetical protein
MIEKWMKIDPVERKRTYVYPPAYTGSPEGKFELTNISALYVSESGTHYLECDQGKVIARCGWMGIILDVDMWTYPKHED